MLDAFIIEELKKREQEELAREAERPRLEIPVYVPYIPYPMDEFPEVEKQTGKIITFEA